MGWPLFLVALAGLLLLLRRPGRRELVLLAFPVPYFLVIGSWSSRFERYTLPLVPFLAVLAACALVAVAAIVRDRRGPRVAAVGLAAAVALLVGPEVARVVHWHVLLTRPDTRVLAADWIERAIPSGARIAMEPYSPAVPLSAAMIEAERGRLGDTVAARIARQRYDRFLTSPAAATGRGYWLFRLSYDLDRLREERIEYVVLSGFVYQRNQRACDRFADACRFYRELAGRGRLVYSIEPGADGRPLWVGDISSPLTRLSERTRPGPSIQIYRLADS
jgi:hypothetical protein